MNENKKYIRTGIKGSLILKGMSNFKLPATVRKAFCYVNRTHDYKYNNLFSKHYKMLDDLHNTHKGERCFVVGMGPSLDQTRFDLIKNEHFIVSNNFYQGLSKFGIKPEYWVVADNAVFDLHAKNLLNLDTNLFLTDEAARIFVENYDHYMQNATFEPIVIRPLGDTMTWMNFSKDLKKGAYGGMVIYSGLQLAYHLGFKDIYLLGCDCTDAKGVHFKGADSFNLQGVVVSDNEWAPTFERYELYKRLFKEEGRTIYNATSGGRLEVFERKSLEDLV